MPMIYTIKAGWVANLLLREIQSSEIRTVNLAILETSRETLGKSKVTDLLKTMKSRRMKWMTWSWVRETYRVMYSLHKRRALEHLELSNQTLRRHNRVKTLLLFHSMIQHQSLKRDSSLCSSRISKAKTWNLKTEAPQIRINLSLITTSKELVT